MFGYGRRLPILSTAKFLISIAILWLLIHSAQIKMELLVSLIQQPVLFFEVIILLLLMILLGAWRWHILNSAQAINLNFYRTMLATYVGAGFNNVLPGSVGGDIVRLLYVLKNVQQKKSQALLTLFSDRIIGLLGVLIIISTASILFLKMFRQHTAISNLSLTCFILSIGFLSVFVSCIWLTKYVDIAAWLSRRYVSDKVWIKNVVAFFNTLKVFSIEKIVVLKCLIISVFIQLLIVAAILLIAHMMSLPSISFLDYLLAISTTQIVNLIPITPGGIGIGEASFSNILLILNPKVTAAYATVLIGYRLMSFLAYVPGVIGYFVSSVIMKRRAQLKENTFQV